MISKAIKLIIILLMITNAILVIVDPIFKTQLGLTYCTIMVIGGIFASFLIAKSI